jgi:hypothetical protein
VLPIKSPGMKIINKSPSFKWIDENDIVGPILEEIRSRGYANIKEFSSRDPSPLQSGTPSNAVS